MSPSLCHNTCGVPLLTHCKLSYYVFASVLISLWAIVSVSHCSLIAHPPNNFHYTVQLPEEEQPLKVVFSEVESNGLEELSVVTPYVDCGSQAVIHSLTVSPCDTRGSNRKTAASPGARSDVCEIVRGSNVTFNLSFTPKVNATKLTAVIHGIYDFVPIPFPCPQPDACKDSGISCPLQADKQYDYVLAAQVLAKYPKIKLWIKGQLEDEDGRNVICVKIHVQLV